MNQITRLLLPVMNVCLFSLTLAMAAGCGNPLWDTRDSEPEKTAVATKDGRTRSQWTENSFEDFRDGTFLDAGSNAYVSAKGRIQIINRWDLNNDGHLDVIMPGGHAQSEKENTYIYLNSGIDIDGRSLIELPGSGSSGGLAADFNKDGLTDLAVVNATTSHNWKVDAFVYYGTPKGISAEGRAELP